MKSDVPGDILVGLTAAHRMQATLSRLVSLAMRFSAARTTLSTRGLPSAVRYAPTPKFSFRESSSFLYAAQKPKQAEV